MYHLGKKRQYTQVLSIINYGYIFGAIVICIYHWLNLVSHEENLRKLKPEIGAVFL